MPETADTFHFIADKGDARSRLDRILVRRVTDVSRLSRNVAQQWIEAGAVSVDGSPARRASARVREGASISISVPATAIRRARPAAEESELRIVHEDESLLVIDKPAGVVVHPSYKQTSGTLLQRDAAAGDLRKRYLAIVGVAPKPPSGRIQLPIGRDPGDRRRMIVADGGAASETEYDVITTDPETAVTLIACTLITGRTHQIRVHLASSGWPIIGDRVYGQPHALIGRQALHAWTITLRHPATRQLLAFESPLPPDMQQLFGAHNTSEARLRPSSR